MTDNKIIDIATGRERLDQQHVTETLSEMAEEVKAHRRQYGWPTLPGDAPVTLEELALAAMERYRGARVAVHNMWSAKLSKAERGREKYTAADPSRPWDMADRQGETVSEWVDKHLDEIRLKLVANNPAGAADALRHTAHWLEKAMERVEERKRRAKRAARKERLGQIEREKIEKEERRLARVREQARKKIAGGAA
jgi:hypothetical protein